jgi:hypothetical protein
MVGWPSVVLPFVARDTAARARNGADILLGWGWGFRGERMRADTRADAEHAVLTTEAGLALLAEVSTVNVPGPSDLARWRRSAPAVWVEAALRLAECRRRGSAKFSRADGMWLEPTALEQATAEPVAQHKAKRFAGLPVILDLCSGLGGDAAALAAQGPVVAVELDRDMARRLRWNVEAYKVEDRVAVVRGRAEAIALSRPSWVHIDPDRRARTGRRARSIGDYAPGLGFLMSLAESHPGGAIKLGPTSDFEETFGPGPFEVELISLGGECKEATAWFGDLAGCRRRATCLPEGATWTDRDDPGGGPVGASAISAFVYDPDPALVRTGLLDGFARAHGLARVAPGVDLLTSEALMSSPFHRGFEVIETLPADLKRLRRLVKERRLGPLEIKVKGLGLRPEELRDRLRPGSGSPATLLLAGGRGRSVAILAHRIVRN